MKESVAIAKEADAKKGFSPTRSDNSIHRVQNEPERQLGSLRSVINNIRRNGGKPSVESIATQMSGMPTGARAPALLALQQTHGNRYVQRVVALARKGEGKVETAPEVEKAIQQALGGGQTMDGKVRCQMESAFGADFSGVRVHTGVDADTLNRALNARAFTTAQDIFFRQGAYNPGSSSGRELLAHELTHVVQQESSTQVGQESIGQVGDAFEQEAAWVGQAVRKGHEVSIETASAAPTLQRQAAAAYRIVTPIPEPTLSEEKMARIKGIATRYLSEWELGSRAGVDAYCSRIIESKESLTRAYAGLSGILAVAGIIVALVAAPPAGVALAVGAVGAGVLGATHGAPIDKIANAFREQFNKKIDEAKGKWEEQMETLIPEKVVPDFLGGLEFEEEVVARYFPGKGREYYKNAMIREMQEHYRKLQGEGKKEEKEGGASGRAH